MSVFAGYVRVSRVGDRSETLISPKLQEKAIRGWAKAHGHKILMLEPELDASGSDDDRPILGDAIAQIERGEFDGLAVWRLDRFARSLASSVRFLARIEEAGGTVESATEPYAADSTGRMSRNITMSIAEGERERQAEGFERAKADAVARCIHVSGHVPLGYVRNGERILEPDPIAAPFVVEAFKMRAGGSSWRVIAEMIGEGLGRPFYGPTVSRMIANPVYLGEARQGKHRNPDAHAPLVDRALWDSAQKSMPRPPRGKHEPRPAWGLDSLRRVLAANDVHDQHH